MGAWRGKEKEGEGEWIQVELGEGTVVTGVMTQGRWAGGQGREWATQVVVQVWEDGRGWVMVGGVREANTDTHSVVVVKLEEEVVTPRLRLVPVSDSGGRTVCLRLEVLGCRENQLQVEVVNT